MKKIWLIGATEGIGRALALELGKDKNNFLILSGRNNDRLVELSKNFDDTLLMPLDVTNKQSVISAWEEIKNKATTIDTVIYCAGYYKPMSAINMEIDEIETMIDVNLTGAMRSLSCVIPEFVDKKKGHIVLIGSVAGYRGLPNSLGYGSSKAGLIHMAENLKCDLSEHGIKVQVINPGFVKTRLTDLNKFKMPSIMTPEDAAKCIVSNMNKNAFESRFPFLLGNLLKLMGNLPYWLYFFLSRRIKG